jgi:Mg2+ and Co2+ transporter CorA
MNSITQIVVRGFTATSNIDERKREIEAAALASTQNKDAISSKLTELEETLSSKTEKLAAAVATAALLESTASTATSRIASSEAKREAAGLAYSKGKDILNF